jgi:hypothetical protein
MAPSVRSVVVGRGHASLLTNLDTGHSKLVRDIRYLCILSPTKCSNTYRGQQALFARSVLRGSRTCADRSSARRSATKPAAPTSLAPPRTIVQVSPPSERSKKEHQTTFGCVQLVQSECCLMFRLVPLRLPLPPYARRSRSAAAALENLPDHWPCSDPTGACSQQAQF